MDHMEVLTAKALKDARTNQISCSMPKQSDLTLSYRNDMSSYEDIYTVGFILKQPSPSQKAFR